MPELLRLQTPVFELSIWANDISVRSRVYRETLKKRASLDSGSVSLLPDPELRFAPDAVLIDIKTIKDVDSSVLLNNSTEINDGALVSDPNYPEKKAAFTLSSPLFFENTQYQFEWVFFESVSNARITHRSRSVSEAFRFAKERGPLPPRLTGTINTGNDVGWMRLPLTFEMQGKIYQQQIAFEVLPTKMALHQDLAAMYRAIDAVYPLWRFSLVEKTEKDAAQSKQRGHFPLMWLANFAQLRERFIQGLEVICSAPHSRLQPTVAYVKAAKLKGRFPYKLGERVKEDFSSGQYDRRYRVEKKQLSVDTPENRFIKMAVNHCQRRLAEFEAKLRASNKAPEYQRLSDGFLDELNGWQQPLKKVLNHSFLKDVGGYGGLNRESLVLQQKTGYSAVYRVWQDLKFYLDLFGNQSSIAMKSVAEIYEVWCFLCLKQILQQNLGFELVGNDAAKLSQNDFFEYQLKDGFAGAFRFRRSDGLVARLAHEPKFTRSGQSIRSYVVSQEPDIVLEVTLPIESDSEEEIKFIWLFDAKYRIKTDRNRFDNDDKCSVVQTDYVPDDAINQMHRYRDALIRLTKFGNDVQASDNESETESYKKSRPVFGAFALYPGFFDQANEENPYANAIQEIGIGAFALLPTQTENDNSGHKWLLDFLQAQLGTAPIQKGKSDNEMPYRLDSMAERLYVQEAARIPYYGMRQVFYSDLTMTVALGSQRGRENAYFTAYEKGTAQWYHLPQKTFLSKFKQHVAEEIRYLALASTAEKQSATKQIDKIWPVKRVSLLPRFAITEEQSGKKSDSEEFYYLFELGRPLRLQRAVANVPHRPMKNSMKLTTLRKLESVAKFSDVERVYEGAVA